MSERSIFLRNLVCGITNAELLAADLLRFIRRKAVHRQKRILAIGVAPEISSFGEKETHFACSFQYASIPLRLEHKVKAPIGAEQTCGRFTIRFNASAGLKPAREALRVGRQHPRIHREIGWASSDQGKTRVGIELAEIRMVNLDLWSIARQLRNRPLHHLNTLGLGFDAYATPRAESMDNGQQYRTDPAAEVEILVGWLFPSSARLPRRDHIVGARSMTARSLVEVPISDESISPRIFRPQSHERVVPDSSRSCTSFRKGRSPHEEHPAFRRSDAVNAEPNIHLFSNRTRLEQTLLYMEQTSSRKAIMNSISRITSIFLLLTLGAACRPEVAFTEGDEDFDGGTMDAGYDADVDAGTGCDGEDAFADEESAEMCAVELALDERDKFAPAIVMVAFWGYNAYRAYRIGRTAHAALTVALAGGRTVQLQYGAVDALAVGTMSTVALINTIRQTGVEISWHEARNIQQRAASEARSYPAPNTVRNQCTPQQNNQLNTYHQYCDRPLNGNSCYSFREEAYNQMQCMDRRRRHGQQCFPQGGRGPMGAADRNHNIAWCNAARRAANMQRRIIQMTRRGECGPNFQIPYVPAVPADCANYI